MQYSVATFEFHFAEDWQTDVFCQSLCDLGFDSFVENQAYIPTAILNTRRAALDELVQTTAGVTLIDISECPDDNWNQAWEAEHPIHELPLGVKIIPHCAFGAGYHETTSMMIDALLERGTFPEHFYVIDHGTGTGVLAIFAKKLGAEHVIAIDIDENSVINARENAALNGEEIEVIQTETLPASFKNKADLVLANIHRNILLAYMPQYAQALKVGGQLWLSGFYETDIPTLLTAAEENNLHLLGQHKNNDWCMLQLRKEI